MMTSLITIFIIVNCYFPTPCGGECSLCRRCNFCSRFVTEGEVVVVWWCDVITFSKLILGDEYVF